MPALLHGLCITGKHFDVDKKQMQEGSGTSNTDHVKHDWPLTVELLQPARDNTHGY